MGFKPTKSRFFLSLFPVKSSPFPFFCKKLSPTSKTKIKNIDHLGIVAGLIDEIGIVEIINSRLGIDPREKISAGIIVKAILINGLGFVSRPLYLFSQFFEDKGIEILLGEEVEIEHINIEITPEERKKRADLNLEGYKWKEEIVTYGGIKQIWLIVESQKRRDSDLEKLEKKLNKEKDKFDKLLKELKKEDFETPEQARYKLRGINKSLKMFAIKEIQIIEVTSKDNKTIYKMEAVGYEKIKEIEILRKEAGRFILATNLVDENKLEPEEIITNYKNQQSCERGFRFLKDPLFFADSFFVENPERIETMLFLMSLCLLVYNLGQRELRNSLKRAKIGIKNQLGKLTLTPTLRWVFQCFQGIHILILNGVHQIVNLTEERNFILNNLPSSCQKYYLLS